MKTYCIICNHPKGKDIDQALIQRVVAKESTPIIAQRFNVSKDSLFNHYNKHLSKIPIIAMLDIKTKQAQREANDDMPLDVRCSRCNGVKLSNEIRLLEAFWNAIKERY